MVNGSFLSIFKKKDSPQTSNVRVTQVNFENFSNFMQKRKSFKVKHGDDAVHFWVVGLVFERTSLIPNFLQTSKAQRVLWATSASNPSTQLFGQR